MFDQLDDRVFRRRFESLDLNVGIVIGDDGVLIVDSRASHREARELLDELAGLTALPVRWVINSHWHWDHVFGNAVMKEAAIWGHERCRSAFERFGDSMRRHAEGWVADEDIAEVELVAPTNTFSERVTVDIGREVTLGYHGLAHTDADIVTLIGDTGVAFMGDLVEEGAAPNFGDSYPLSWPETLRSAMADVNASVVVPGHGDVVDRAFVAGQIEELALVADLARGVLGGGVALAEAVAGGPYPSETMKAAMERAVAVD